MNDDWGIVYYQGPTQSNSPIQEFIESLEKRAQNKIVRTLELLESYGLKLGMPYTKKMAGTDLWELRILGQDNLRIFYVAITGKSFLLLHGFNEAPRAYARGFSSFKRQRSLVLTLRARKNLHPRANARGFKICRYKKKQKTDKKEIETALARLRDFHFRKSS